MKKRIVGFFMASVLMLSMLTGCATTPDNSKPSSETVKINGFIVNKEFNSNEMTSIAGNPYKSKGDAKTICEKLNGIGVTITDAMAEEIQSEDNCLMATVMEEGIVVDAGTEKLRSIYPTEEEFKKMSDEERMKFYETANQYSVYLFAVLKETKEMPDPEHFAKLKGKFEHIEKLVDFDGATFYFAYNTDLNEYELTEDEKVQFGEIVNNMQYIKDNICIFTAQESDAPQVFQGNLNEFSATTMTSKEIDQSVFADYDITMVNVWATWCGYCVEELPDIQKLYSQLPKNVNIISICTDASTETELAQTMIDETGIKFETLKNNENLEKNFISHIEALPTTVFVDSKGNIIGNAQTGLPGEDVVAGYQALIDNALKMIGK